MLKSSCLLSAVLFCTVFSPLLNAGELIRPAGSKQDWNVKRGRIVKNENGVTRVTLPCLLELKPAKRIKIEPGKRYNLSGEFRFVGREGQELSKPLVFGYMSYLDNGTRIYHASVLRLYKNFAQLVKDVPKGATSIIIKGDARVKHWERRLNRGMGSHYHIAFGVKADNSDLPNFRLSPRLKDKGITRLENGNWKIEFRSPLTFEAPAGEDVGFHYIGASYMNVEKGRVFGGEWNKLSGTYAAKAAKGVQPFYVGTEAVGFAFFCHHRGGAIEFRNICMTEEE